MINKHGAPAHNQALLDAAEYFEHRFGGTMAVLASLIHEDGMKVPDHLSPDHTSENGMDVHAGEEKSSQMLFLRPDLVHDDLFDAPAFTAATPGDLLQIAKRPNWLGYFGSPRLATPAAGALVVDFRTRQTIDLALPYSMAFTGEVCEREQTRPIWTRASGLLMRTIDDAQTGSEPYKTNGCGRTYDGGHKRPTRRQR